MIHGDFNRSKGAKTVRLLGRLFRVVVEALDDACGNRPSGAELVED
jgi:hypothetical protein